MIQTDISLGTLREVDCESRRRRILEAARSLIVDGGMQAVSMRLLGKDAGLQETVLFGHNELALHHYHNS